MWTYFVVAAIALYEYFSSMMDLMQIQNAERLFTAKQYLVSAEFSIYWFSYNGNTLWLLQDQLIEIEQLAKESISMLIYEPPLTPEGHLAKYAMGRLKLVRSLIEKQKRVNVVAAIKDDINLCKRSQK